MIVIGLVLAALAALLHVYIFVLESLLWTTPRARSTFGTSEEISHDWESDYEGRKERIWVWINESQVPKSGARTLDDPSYAWYCQAQGELLSAKEKIQIIRLTGVSRALTMGQ